MLTSDQLMRYEADRLVLGEIFPRMTHKILASGAGAFATGEVDVDMGAGSWEQVDLRLVFSPPYPIRPPKVFDRAKRWTPNMDRHLMPDHEFCLWLALVDQPDVATPGGLREFLLRLLPFLRDQFVFDDVGHWPGPEWAHGAQSAYAQHIIETLDLKDIATFRSLWPLVNGRRWKSARACPCGSGQPYGSCHERRVAQLLDVAQIPNLDLSNAIVGRLTLEASS
jgi:SEC-C motif